MKIRLGFRLLFLYILFSSCSMERKLAMEFIRQKETKTAVLVVPPFSLEMYNNNEYNFDSVYIPANFPLDSALFQQTKLIKQISDSVFLEKYLNAYINSLQKIGFQVYLPNEVDTFLKVAASAYVFKFAQIELREEIYPYAAEEEINGKEFNKIFNLNLVSLDSWFEFEARDTAWRKVFYAENAVMDEFSGDFLTDNKTGNLVYYYNVDSLSVKEVYQLAEDVGNVYAEYFTDYLMNNYIEQHFRKNKKATLFFHYDSELKMLFPFEEGFEEISLSK